MEREGRAMVLTEAGRRVRAVLAELVVGLDAVRSAARGAPVAATLVAGESVLRWLVLPTLCAVLTEAPGVDLSLRGVTRGYALVRDGDADFALSRSRRKEDGMLVRPIGTLRYQLFVPHALRGRATDLHTIAALPFVHVTGAPEAMEQYAHAIGRPPRVALRCESFPQAAQVVASGGCVAVLPTLAARDLLPSVASPVALPGLGALDLKLALVARERRLASSPALAPLHRALAERLRETLRERPGATGSSRRTN
jgi:DNA-binding transcriptional LysR family regulator